MSIENTSWAPPKEPTMSYIDALKARAAENADDIEAMVISDRTADVATQPVFIDRFPEGFSVNAAPETPAPQLISEVPGLSFNQATEVLDTERTVSTDDELVEEAPEVYNPIALGNEIKVMRSAKGKEGEEGYVPAYEDDGWEIVKINAPIRLKSGQIKVGVIVKKNIDGIDYQRPVLTDEVFAMNGEVAEAAEKITAEEAKKVGNTTLEAAGVTVTADASRSALEKRYPAIPNLPGIMSGGVVVSQPGPIIPNLEGIMSGAAPAPLEAEKPNSYAHLFDPSYEGNGSTQDARVEKAETDEERLSRERTTADHRTNLTNQIDRQRDGGN